ncbi:hypothetical protein [Clostridium ihumii]|uniref:hypothetical protein n=1 Tax=Clostridium ihumii TaxID=1470356 RepID=UPI003D3510CA
MNNDILKQMNSTDREKFMREELGKEKCKVLDKYNLVSNNKLYWQRVQEKYPTQEYFSHKFAKKSSVLGMIFHIYKLCFAKTKYFEKNWEKFEPCIYSLKDGFIKTEMYNMEFIRHKTTGIVIDLRELSKIHWLQDFKDICNYIESEEKKLYLENKRNLA